MKSGDISKPVSVSYHSCFTGSPAQTGCDKQSPKAPLHRKASLGTRKHRQHSQVFALFDNTGRLGPDVHRRTVFRMFINCTCQLHTAGHGVHLGTTTAGNTHRRIHETPLGKNAAGVTSERSYLYDSGGECRCPKHCAHHTVRPKFESAATTLCALP